MVDLSEIKEQTDFTSKANMSLQSYMTKDEFITMLQNLRFNFVKNAEIDVCTNSLIDVENKELNNYSYKINIY